MTEDLTGDVSSTSLHAGSTPPFTTHHPAAYLSIEAGHLSESMQQPKVAKISTKLISETWATELSYDPDMGFMCSIWFSSTPLKDQIEAQLIEGIQQDHFVVADQSHMPAIINALGAVPQKDSDEVGIIMDCSRPLTMNANSCKDLERYKYVTVDNAANLCQPGCCFAKLDLKNAFQWF